MEYTIYNMEYQRTNKNSENLKTTQDAFVFVIDSKSENSFYPHFFDVKTVLNFKKNRACNDGPKHEKI